MKKIKRGIIKDNKVCWRTYSYPIVIRVTRGWDYEEEQYEEGAEVKFKIIHKPSGVNRIRRKFRNELCAIIL